MPKIDVVDEAIINASPLTVYQAILDEYAGNIHWMPNLILKPRPGTPARCEGAVCDISVKDKGVSANFTVKTTKLVEGKTVEFEYSGDFLGTGTWTLEPFGEKTRLQYRFNVKTNRALFSFLSLFTDVSKPHSNTMLQGFIALNRYLTSK